MQIHREISEQGYPGAYQNVVRITRYLKEQEVLEESLPDTSPGISVSQATGILLKRSENRCEEELRTLKRLKTLHQVTESDAAPCSRSSPGCSETRSRAPKSKPNRG
jgi:hypothetical protein